MSCFSEHPSSLAALWIFFSEEDFVSTFFKVSQLSTSFLTGTCWLFPWINKTHPAMTLSCQENEVYTSEWSGSWCGLTQMLPLAKLGFISQWEKWAAAGRTWIELQAAAGWTFLGAREKSSAVHRPLLAGEGGMVALPCAPGALLIQWGLPALLSQKQKENFWKGG